jgi:hypothetical protein
VKEALTLADTDMDLISLGQMMAEKPSIPEILVVTELTRQSAQIPPNCLSHGFVKGGRTTRTKVVLKASKTSLLESPDPVLNGPRTPSKDAGYLVTTEPRAYQENPVKAVVVTGLLRSKDFILQCESHDFSIPDLKLAHRYPLSV